jgi:cytochrome c biogenesis protein CcmG/thiol:disulfide interchange protein DsbE
MIPLVYFILVFFIASKIIPQVYDNQYGRGAPNFMLENLEGDIVELNDFIGKGPILISFYASICKPCRVQVEAFSKIYTEYKNERVMLIAISIDDQRTVAKVKPYIKSKGYTFPVLYDTNNDVSRIYYAGLVPYTLLIDKNGSIVYSHLGYMKGDEIQAINIIEKLLHN